MIADVLTSIKAYLYDRTSSPLLGAFATSLALWNFKILMLFFSKTPYAVKVWEIDFFYSQPFFSIDSLSWLTNYWMCLYLMPAVTSLFYIYVFPWFSHRVFEFSYNKQIALNNKKKEMQGSELISAEEKEELLSQIEKLNVENRANVLKLREDITQLASQRDSVIKEREDLKSENDKLRIEVDGLREMYNSLDTTSGDAKRPNARSFSANNLDNLIPISGIDDTMSANQLKHLISSLSTQNKKLQDATRDQIATQAAKVLSSEDSDDNKSNVAPKSFKGSEESKQANDSPSYVRFYESLSDDKKVITEQILSTLLDNASSLEIIHLEVNYEQVLGDDKGSLRKYLNQMKLYDIIEINDYGSGLMYSLTHNGEELYKYILEGGFAFAS
ncbi:TPA: hypothetical protein ACMDVJ_003872 [Vibrio parahaemolyticus]